MSRSAIPARFNAARTEAIWREFWSSAAAAVGAVVTTPAPIVAMSGTRRASPVATTWRRVAPAGKAASTWAEAGDAGNAAQARRRGAIRRSFMAHTPFAAPQRLGG